MPQPSLIKAVVGIDYSYTSDETGYVIYNKAGKIVHADRVATSCCAFTNSQRALLWLSERTVTMTPADYASQSKEFALYPKTATTYPFLGLAGEGGELLAAISTFGLKPINRENVLKEIGDVCWYFAEVCRVTGLSFEAMIGFDEHKDIESVNPPLDLPTTIAAICELAKKSLRDEGGAWGEERKARLEAQLRRLGLVILCCCRRYGWPLSDVLLANIQKLTDRRDRNKLKGDGDNR